MQKPPDGSDLSREQMLETLGNLLYAEGTHPSAFDAALAAAGVSRSGLEDQFGSDEELLRAALEHRFETRMAELEEMLAALDDPMARLWALVRIHGETVALTWFSLCPLVKAAVEKPDSQFARELAQSFKARVRDLLLAAAHSAGLRDPEGLARGLVMLIEGASILAYIGDRVEARNDLQESAKTLIASHMPAAGSV